MPKRLLIAMGATAIALGGCSSLEFTDGFSSTGATYFDPQPVAVRKCNKDGEEVWEFSTIPGRVRSVRPRAGLLGGELSTSFENGMISEFGQTNTAIDPELLSTVAGLAGLGGAESLAEGGGPASSTWCVSKPEAQLFTVSVDADGTLALRPARIRQ